MNKKLLVLVAVFLIAAVLLTACGKKEDGMVGNKANPNNTGKTASERMNEAETKVKNAADEVGERAGEAAKDAGDTVGDVVSGAADAVRDGVTGAGEVVSDVVSPNG